MTLFRDNLALSSEQLQQEKRRSREVTTEPILRDNSADKALVVINCGLAAIKVKGKL